MSTIQRTMYELLKVCYRNSDTEGKVGLGLRLGLSYF